MIRDSIYNLLKKVSKESTPTKRIEKLREVDTPVLRGVLKHAFDPGVKFLLPEGAPPYKENDFPSQEHLLYNNYRRMYLFVEGGRDDLKPIKREMLFIQFLETIDKDDAKLMIAVKDKKIPFKGITANMVKKAFPDLY